VCCGDSKASNDIWSLDRVWSMQGWSLAPKPLILFQARTGPMHAQCTRRDLFQRPTFIKETGS
jgi:hypothetical protein